jgi:hypothetical protein
VTCGPCGCPLRSVKLSAAQDWGGGGGEKLQRGTGSSEPSLSIAASLFYSKRHVVQESCLSAALFTSWNTTAIRSVCVAGRKQRTAQHAQRVTSVRWKQDKSVTRSNPQTIPTYLPKTIKYGAGCERTRTAARPVVLRVRCRPCTWLRNLRALHLQLEEWPPHPAVRLKPNDGVLSVVWNNITFGKTNTGDAKPGPSLQH